MANSINYDSFFTKTVVDPNGVTVCDMNAGLDNLYKYFNDYADRFDTAQRYFVPEHEEGYPDLIAARSILGSQDFWWWVLLLNRQDDAFEGLKQNWVYSIATGTQVETFIQDSTTAKEASSDDRIGTVIELN